MIHVNQSPQSYVYPLTGAFSPGAYYSGVKMVTLQENLGRPSLTAGFFTITITSAPGGTSAAYFRMGGDPPTQIGPSLGTWVTSASMEVVIEDAAIHLTTDCIATMDCTGITVAVNGTIYLTLPGFTGGILTTTWNEAENYTLLSAYAGDGAPSLAPDICTNLPFSLVETATATGGYAPASGADPIIIDDTSTGSCPCIMQPGSITGTTSDAVTFPAILSYTLAQIDPGTVDCACPHRAGVPDKDVTVGFYTAIYTVFSSNNDPLSCFIGIKDANTGIGSETLTTGWRCDMDGEPETYGSSTTISTPSGGSTVCQSGRTMSMSTTNTFCIGTFDPTVCPGLPAGGFCVHPTPPFPAGCMLCPPPTNCVYLETVYLNASGIPPCIPTGTTRGINIFQGFDGNLMVVSTDDDNLSFSYSATGQLPFNYTTRLTTTSDWSFPTICQDSYGQIEMKATRIVAGMGSTYRLWSNDQGQTWNPLVAGVLTPELVLANSVQSTLRGSFDGDLLEMTFVPDVSTAGPGSFSARWKGSGDASFGLAYVPTIAGGGDLRSDGTGFGIDHANEGPNRWWLTMVSEGDALPSIWTTGDFGASWDRE